MPAWPGGACPQCGEEMPANLVHCRNCRVLLNTDLESDSVEIPQFIPLKELDSYVELQPEGYYVSCPLCDRELRVHKKFLGKHVACNICAGAYTLDFSNPRVEKIGLYADCPHCKQRLRMATKYAGTKVTCKFCSGRLKIVE